MSNDKGGSRAEGIFSNPKPIKEKMIEHMRGFRRELLNYRYLMICFFILGVLCFIGLLSVFFFMFYPYTIESQKNGLLIGYIIAIILTTSIWFLVTRNLFLNYGIRIAAAESRLIKDTQ